MKADATNNRTHIDLDGCTEGHKPSTRITKTNVCVQCEKTAIVKLQNILNERFEKQSKLKNCKHKATYTFPFPDGERYVVGPFTTSAKAVSAFKARFKQVYGEKHNDQHICDVVTPPEAYFEFPQEVIDYWANRSQKHPEQ